MFDSILDEYDMRGRFTFRPDESLKEKCDAPCDQAGVYLIYKTPESPDNLLYIGLSGQMRDGKVKVRQSGLGGMRDRIVNGYHPRFGRTSRRITFPVEMEKAGIQEIAICWWVTWSPDGGDPPTEVELRLTEVYRATYGRLPLWHS
jgi:hypothetical protein